MLTKILFTLAVIAGVIIFFRYKHGVAPGQTAGQSAEQADDGYSVSPRAVAYGLLGLLAGVSVVVFVLNWQTQNRIVQLRVITDGEVATTYQTRHKSIKGRHFVTLDGTRIVLGESERIEMVEQ